MIKTTGVMEVIPSMLTNGSSTIISLMRLVHPILLLEEPMVLDVHQKSSVKIVCLLLDAGRKKDQRYMVLSNLEW